MGSRKAWDTKSATGLMGLVLNSGGDLEKIQAGLTNATDHPSSILP